MSEQAEKPSEAINAFFGWIFMLIILFICSGGPLFVLELVKAWRGTK